MKWDLHDCVSEDMCHLWRAAGDPACDAALEVLFPTATSYVGKDLLATLEDYAAQNPEPNPATSFLEEVSQQPPSGLQVSEEDVGLAQSFFLDYAIQIMQALLHYSLAAGFASSRIVRTLQAVSYLVPPLQKTGSTAGQPASSASDARTFSRLLETFQFVLDVMGCTAELPAATPKWGNLAYLMPGGEGWKSTVRVRMLHGIARRRARERLARVHFDDTHTLDVPISQEDMGATLVSFSTVPIWALKRLHLNPPAKQVNAYLAVWRHVGFYLGVSPSILTRYLHSPSTADKFLASVVLDLFSDDAPPNPDSLPTIPILRAASHRPPSMTSLEYNIAVTRHLVGRELADHLGLPPTSLWTGAKLHASLTVQKIPVWFGAWYPRSGWLVKRRAVLREGIARSLRWNLGMRRVSFRPRTDVEVAGTAAAGAEKDLGGALASGVKEAERVAPNPVAGRRLAREWREVLAEMIGVFVLCAVVVTYITIQVWFILLSLL